ncbi:unnamed protein product, partial [marine sediment metagenome]
IESQKQEIKTLGGKVGELTDRVADLGKPATGRTEMDILHEIASEGIGVLKTELPGFRRDIKEAIGSTVLPPAKSTEEWKERTTKLRQAVKADEDIEEIGLTKPLPSTGVVDTAYKIEGTAKAFDGIGALPWVYAQVRF